MGSPGGVCRRAAAFADEGAHQVGGGYVESRIGYCDVRGELAHRAGAKALVQSLEFRGTGPVWSLQELHKELA